MHLNIKTNNAELPNIIVPIVLALVKRLLNEWKKST